MYNFSFLPNVTGVIAIEVQWQKWNLTSPPFLSQNHTGLFYNDKFFHISQIKIAYMYICFCCLTNKYYFLGLHILFLVHVIRHQFMSGSVLHKWNLGLKYAVVNCTYFSNLTNSCWVVLTTSSFLLLKIICFNRLYVGVDLRLKVTSRYVYEP